MKPTPLHVDFIRKDGSRTSKTFYEFLEVPENASQEDLKKAYRKKAFDWHPDRNPGNQIKEQYFKVLQNVYSYLKDPEKRRTYDAQLSSLRRPVQAEDVFDMRFEEMFEFVMKTKWKDFYSGTTTSSNSTFWD